MAEPIVFNEANAQWYGEGDAGALPAYRDAATGVSVSCWELTAAEQVEILETGKVWLYVWGNHPAVSVTGTHPFKEPTEVWHG